ncbi:conserved hypothetical protein [Methanothermus fervidus DSM 2088]|uniref:Uncharacterized protein n=1 Tax=Methanothermus fervidus (strain ATCC 43054 / DSM 2088 / JCM 10308 / V24 S) TaxID=523846 RepID=E3GW74_METFV|nr:hypothetical protein [Methanothermus fervidus]ADP77839.1 conserved hypothetical protein [Methanothermus fervidus DSM 2088]
MRKFMIFIAIIAVYLIHVHYVVANGPFIPLGRLAFVKLANPDMYPGHPHSKVLAEYAKKYGSKCALVVHYCGGSNYRHYMEGDVLIIQLAYIEKNKPYTTTINWSEVWREGIYGIPDNEWEYKADGKVFKNLDDALSYVEELAKRNGQKGPIPLVYHGTVREGNVIINQGCGFPLYYYLLRKEYGPLVAYYYVIKGILFPYFNLPYRDFEIRNAPLLQFYYTNNMLNYE